MQINPQQNLSTLSSKTIEPHKIKVRPQHISQQGLDCRICLETMAKEDLLEICKCKGTNANVHEKCLVEWIKKSKTYRFWLGEYYSTCDICKANIYLQTVTKLRWIRSEEFGSELFNKHRCCTILTFLSIFCNFVAIVIISFLCSVSQVGITSSVFIIAYCIVVGLMLLTFLIYVVKCMIKRDISEIKILQKKGKKSKLPIKESPESKEIDDREFVLERGTTMDSIYPERTRNILIN